MLMRQVCCAALGVLLIASCDKQPEVADIKASPGVDVPEDAVSEPEVVEPPVTPDVPHQIAVNTEYFVGSVKVDDALFQIAPDLAARLMEDARGLIDAMEGDAAAYKEADPDYFNPYSLSLEWTLKAVAGDLISLDGFAASYTGGAHGNYGTDARIYDLVSEKQIFLRDMLADPEEAMAASLPVLLADIAKQRTAKVGGEGSTETFRSEAADALSAESLLNGEIGLVASTRADAFGGLAVHFAPYEIGSYAEGAYRVVIPQVAFHEYLKPEYAALFAGEPAAEE